MKQNSYLLVSAAATFVLLLVCTLKGIFIGFPLLLCFLNFAFIAHLRGYPFKEIIGMSGRGGAKSLIVLQILILVGAITSLWISSGTTPAILYYGIQHINPRLFVLCIFLISSAVSFLLGTAFGTISTVGVALILLAKGGLVNPNLAAGAIIAGAYFGDRCSPMSSSANLVANLTHSDLYTNIKGMFKSGAVPFVLSALIYLVLSYSHPLRFTGTTMLTEISALFSLHWLVITPALIIFIFAILRIDVRISMTLSIVLAVLVGMEVQHYSLLELLKTAVLGFSLRTDSPLRTILNGGGILSMAKVAVVIYISCCLAGILAETDILQSLDELLASRTSRPERFIITIIASVLTSILGCSQTISIVMTHSLMDKVYAGCELSSGKPETGESGNTRLRNSELALDLENTSVPLAALIPWNTAGFVPASTLNVSLIGFIPYTYFLYLLPLIQLIYFYLPTPKLTISKSHT